MTADYEEYKKIWISGYCAAGRTYQEGLDAFNAPAHTRVNARFQLEDLDPEAKRILYANLWELYDGERPVALVNTEERGQ